MTLLASIAAMIAAAASAFYLRELGRWSSGLAGSLEVRSPQPGEAYSDNGRGRVGRHFRCLRLFFYFFNGMNLPPVSANLGVVSGDALHGYGLTDLR